MFKVRSIGIKCFELVLDFCEHGYNVLLDELCFCQFCKCFLMLSPVLCNPSGLLDQLVDLHFVHLCELC